MPQDLETAKNSKTPLASTLGKDAAIVQTKEQRIREGIKDFFKNAHGINLKEGHIDFLVTIIGATSNISKVDDKLFDEIKNSDFYNNIVNVENLSKISDRKAYDECLASFHRTYTYFKKQGLQLESCALDITSKNAEINNADVIRNKEFAKIIAIEKIMHDFAKRAMQKKFAMMYLQIAPNKNEEAIEKIINSSLTKEKRATLNLVCDLVTKNYTQPIESKNLKKIVNALREYKDREKLFSIITDFNIENLMDSKSIKLSNILLKNEPNNNCIEDFHKELNEIRGEEFFRREAMIRELKDEYGTEYLQNKGIGLDPYNLDSRVLLLHDLFLKTDVIQGIKESLVKKQIENSLGTIITLTKDNYSVEISSEMVACFLSKNLGDNIQTTLNKNFDMMQKYLKISLTSANKEQLKNVLLESLNSVTNNDIQKELIEISNLVLRNEAHFDQECQKYLDDTLTHISAIANINKKIEINGMYGYFEQIKEAYDKYNNSCKDDVALKDLKIKLKGVLVEAAECYRIVNDNHRNSNSSVKSLDLGVKFYYRSKDRFLKGEFDIIHDKTGVFEIKSSGKALYDNAKQAKKYITMIYKDAELGLNTLEYYILDPEGKTNYDSVNVQLKNWFIECDTQKDAKRYAPKAKILKVNPFKKDFLILNPKISRENDIL